VTFTRLRAAHWVVFLASLALILTTAADWYSTVSGEEARRIEEQARPDPDVPSGQVQREVEEDASALAEGQERTAWQEDGAIDRLILIALLATAALGVAAAFRQASGHESDGLGPFGVAGLAACVTALLVLYRILQEPGFDAITTVQYGAPLALGVLGVLAFACASALREESREPRPTIAGDDR
jgi:hypothetical protein